MSRDCNNCKTKIDMNANFCINCGEKIEQVASAAYNEILRECKGNMGFSSGVVYAYGDRIEFVGKKGTKEIKYSSIKEVKKSFGSLSLIYVDGRTDAINVNEDTDGWLKLIEDKIDYVEDENNGTSQSKGGIFTGTQRSMAQSTYERTKRFLKEKDGKVHVVMINSFSKFLNQNFECEDKYTTQIDEIISCMQEDGYEIVDIKFNSVKNQGILGDMEGFHTLIMYR